MTCSGPYTRVFLTDSDGRQCRRLASALDERGLTLQAQRYPTGDDPLEDLSFDATVGDAAGDRAVDGVHLYKYLGPKRRLRQTHVYEIAVECRDGDAESPWRGHLFADTLPDLVDRFADLYPVLAAGETRDAFVPAAEAHEVRILMCAGEW